MSGENLGPKLPAPRWQLLVRWLPRFSHEIQNRISGVSLWTQYLDAELPPDDPKREYLEEMKAGLCGFTGLLADLKQFYRTPVLQLSDIDLNGLVQSTLRSVERQLNQRDIHLETSLEASLRSSRAF